MVTVEELIETNETTVGQNRLAPSPWYKRGGNLDNVVEKQIIGSPRWWKDR